MTTNKSNTSLNFVETNPALVAGTTTAPAPKSKKSAPKYRAVATYLKQVGNLMGLGHTAQEMSFEVFEAVRKEVTAPKISARTVVSTSELTPEVKALVESVCTDKNHPWYVRKQVIRFFSTVCRFPLTSDGKWKQDDLVVKQVKSIQGRLTKCAKGYTKENKDGTVTKFAPWEKYPVILQEVEKEKTEKAKSFKPAKDMIEKLINQFQGENAEQIEGSSEYATLLSFVMQNKELINFVKDHFEELEAKRVEATK